MSENPSGHENGREFFVRSFHQESIMRNLSAYLMYLPRVLNKSIFLSAFFTESFL